MTTLPPRPYIVSSRWARKRALTAVGLSVLAAVVFAGAGWFTKYQAHKIHEDEAIWATGVIADDSHVSGRETSHEFVINEYNLTTEYRDDQGGSHVGSLSFELLFVSIANGSEVMLKYDRADPRRHTVSWAVQHAGARWGFVGFMDVVFAGLFGLGSLFVARRQLGMLSHARLVAARSDEVTLEVVAMKPIFAGRRHTFDAYEYVHAGKRAKQSLPAKEVPLFTDDKRTHLVALVSPAAPDRPWIMRADHTPFIG